MKPFQIIVLAVFGFAALAGLLFFANFGGFGGGKDAAGPVTIWGTLPEEAMQAGIDILLRDDKRFEDVKYVEVEATNFGRMLADAIASGTGPDLIIINQEQLLAESGKLSIIPYSTISERAFVSAYLPEFELYLTDSGTYGIPLVLDPLVLFYNRPILSSAGIATPPASWEMLNGYTALVTKKAGDTIIESLIPFGTFGNVADARGILSLLFLQSGSAISSQETGSLRAALTGEASVTANAVSALSFYTQFADPAKTVYTWNRNLPFSTQAFLSGDLALYPGFASEYRFIESANPNLDFDIAPIPQPGTASAKSTYGLAYAFAIPKQSGNIAGALSSALALAEGKYVQAIATELGMAPARRDLLTAAADDKYAAVYYPAALTARGWLSPDPATTDGIFSAMIENVITGRTSVAEALTKANQALDAAPR